MFRHSVYNLNFVAHCTHIRSTLSSAGNCWFVAAASVLVTGPRAQFERVVPPDQSFEPGEYAGTCMCR